MSTPGLQKCACLGRDPTAASPIKKKIVCSRRARSLNFHRLYPGGEAIYTPKSVPHRSWERFTGIDPACEGGAWSSSVKHLGHQELEWCTQSTFVTRTEEGKCVGTVVRERRVRKEASQPENKLARKRKEVGRQIAPCWQRSWEPPSFM